MALQCGDEADILEVHGVIVLVARCYIVNEIFQSSGPYLEISRFSGTLEQKV